MQLSGISDAVHELFPSLTSLTSEQHQEHFYVSCLVHFKSYARPGILYLYLYGRVLTKGKIVVFAVSVVPALMPSA